MAGTVRIEQCTDHETAKRRAATLEELSFSVRICSNEAFLTWAEPMVSNDGHMRLRESDPEVIQKRWIVLAIRDH